MSMIIYRSLGNLEVDYDKKEVRAGGQIIDFGQTSHYEFEHIQTGHINYESMRVCGACEELPDMSLEAERHAVQVDKVGLKLWFNYYQCEELKTSSLDFSQKDAIEARHKLKPLIMHIREWRASDDFNMFVGDQHLRIGNLVSLNIPQKEFHLQSVELPVFGPCTILTYGTDVIVHVNLVTERRLSEEEMLPLLDYMKRSLLVSPYYNDHGCGGVMPKPHEINLFWEVPQGRIEMTWDGFDYTRLEEPNQPMGDGMDYVRIELYDSVCMQNTRDEEYYRSLVD